MKKVEAIATEPEWAGGWKEALDQLSCDVISWMRNPRDGVLTPCCLRGAYQTARGRCLEGSWQCRSDLAG